MVGIVAPIQNEYQTPQNNPVLLWHIFFNYFFKPATMQTDKHLQFIKNRILDSGQAVMYRYIDETHKQAIGIKKNLVMDDAGQLYFPLTEKFEQKYSDDIFPVELFFYKKGNAFYVTAKGIATKSNKELHEYGNGYVPDANMVRVQMDEIEYSELPALTHDSLWVKCMKFIGNLNAAF